LLTDAPHCCFFRNAFHQYIEQPTLTEVMDAIVARNRTVRGHAGGMLTSLSDLGYRSFGIDGAWALLLAACARSRCSPRPDRG
jgi:hypothetical protein